MKTRKDLVLDSHTLVTQVYVFLRLILFLIAGGSDPRGPPPGGAISVQRLWISGPDCTGLRVRSMQCPGLLQLSCSQALLERQESDHSPVPAV